MVRIVDLPTLEQFLREWKHHSRLEPQQLAFAGKAAQVAKVGFYHGGDPLYALEGLPGVWHEPCDAAENKKVWVDSPVFDNVPAEPVQLTASRNYAHVPGNHKSGDCAGLSPRAFYRLQVPTIA